jgi:integrase
MAQDLLNHIKTTRSPGIPWIFPGRFKGKKPAGRVDDHWRMIREDTGMEDGELHDCGYTFAVLAIRSGESIINVAVLRDISSSSTLYRMKERASIGVQEGVQRNSDSIRHKSDENDRS